MREGWQSVPLGSVVTVKGGGTPSKDVDRYWAGDIPWVSPKDMRSDRVGTSIDAITPEAIENSATNLLPGGAVLVVVRSGILARRVPTAITTRELTINQDIKALIPSRKLDQNFLHYFLWHAEPKLLELVTRGATVHRLSTDALRTLIIPLPPLPEQKRVVAILDAAFEGIDTAITNAERNLANACSLFEIIRNSAFTRRDETWTETTLGAIAEFKNGLNFTKHSAGTQVGIVGVKDFQSNFFVPTDELAVVRIDGSLSDDYRLRSGDILTVRSNGNKELIGRCLLARDVPDGTSHSGFTIRIRLRNDDVEPAYLAHYLKTGTVRAMLVGSGGGTNISSLNQTALKQLPVAYPTRGAQQRMIERLNTAYERTEALTATLRAKLEALSALKQSVLSKAFTGRLTGLSDSAFDAAAEVAAE